MWNQPGQNRSQLPRGFTAGGFENGKKKRRCFVLGKQPADVAKKDVYEGFNPRGEVAFGEESRRKRGNASQEGGNLPPPASGEEKRRGFPSRAASPGLLGGF